MKMNKMGICHFRRKGRAEVNLVKRQSLGRGDVGSEDRSSMR